MKHTTAATGLAMFVAMFAFSSAMATTEAMDLSSLVGEVPAEQTGQDATDVAQKNSANAADAERSASADAPAAEPEAQQDEAVEAEPEAQQDDVVDAESAPEQDAVKIAADEPGLTDEEQVIAVQQAWIDAEVARDEAVLNRVLDDRYMINSNSGTPGNKAGAIAAVMGWNLASQTISNQTVLVDADTAIVMGTAHFGIAVPGQPNAMSAARYTSTYIKRDGQWRVIALQMNGIKTN